MLYGSMRTFAVLLSVALASAATSSPRPPPTRAPPRHNAPRQTGNSLNYPNYRLSPLDGSVIALPTPDQLAFQDREMGVLIHFNMATYLDIDGCNGVPGLVPDPSLFDPSLLDTDQWLASAAAAGAGYATLVAKHNCGFATWPSEVVFATRDSDNSNNTTNTNSSSVDLVPYNYTIAYSPVGGNGGTDVVRRFADSAARWGVGHGFYYSTVVNNFLNVQDSLVNATWAPGEVRISNETYDEIVVAQLTELWANYGNLTEVSGGWRTADSKRDQ